MKVYRLTNKVTHARAVVVARDEHEAVRTHPTCDGAHRREGGWYTYKLAGRSAHSVQVLTRVPPPAGWPLDVSLVHADALAEVNPIHYRDICVGAVAYQADLQLRVGPLGHEGPDASWGGYTLDNLTHFGPHEQS